MMSEKMNPKLFTLIAGMVMCTKAQAANDKPNIVIIFNDDMGYADIGCFGAEKIKTPRIDQMAKEGRRFTDFYVASSVCSASRAALLTGCYPRRVGVPGVFFPNRGSHGLDPKHFTIAELLKSVGYKTLAAGKWHLTPLSKSPHITHLTRRPTSPFGLPPAGYLARGGGSSAMDCH